MPIAIQQTDILALLMITHLIASLVAAELRNLRAAIWALVVQSFLLACIIASFAFVWNNYTLLIWAFITIATKVVIIPALLFYMLHITSLTVELRPLIGLRASLLFGTVLIVVFYWILRTYIYFVAPTQAAMVEPARSSLTVAFCIFSLGVYVLITRRDVIKVVIGLHLLENGAHLALITLAPALPTTTKLGIWTNVVVAAYMIVKLTEGIYKTLGVTDTLALSELKR
ncbi:MAG: NADH-quinone oxidoreductase subunit K [Armatimonadota bacterium]|nr:NADH-quinone oxidoreductase subunit K [Armatimonadota bacterium]MCX7776581.1 NADH-quinone oxidoreductase subunit K [Armatimonadota bacterium]MDW8026085.1 NADH-quinone oxidoreductase subunit K [Armatimonadota bacterium]